MPAVGTVVAIGNDASPREVSSRISGTWTAPISVTGTTASHSRIKPLTDSLWFTINANDDGPNAFDPDFGPGSRSKDGGATWAATPQPGSDGGMRDIAISPDGRLWCIVHDSDSSTTRTVIYWSDDDGDTWTLSKTHGSGGGNQRSLGWRMICHPVDSNIIAAVGDAANLPSVGNLRGYILYSTDRGDNWTVNYRAGLRLGQGNTLEYADAIILSTGRILVCGYLGTGTTSDVFYTDNYGVSFTSVFSGASSHRTQGFFVSEDESAISFIVNDNPAPGKVEFWLSTDGGDSFAETTLPAGEFVQTEVRSMAASSDTIYIATSLEAVYQLFPVSDVGVWTNISSGFQHSNTGNDMLGAIPGTITSNTFTSAADGGMVFSGDSVDISVNIPETPDPEDTVVSFSPFSALFRGSPIGSFKNLLKLLKNM